LKRTWLGLSSQDREFVLLICVSMNIPAFHNNIFAQVKSLFVATRGFLKK